MVPPKQTAVTDQNQRQFYQNVYRQQLHSKSKLVQLDQHPADCYIMVDCCGWHYKNIWTQCNVLSIETESSIKSFGLQSESFDGTIDDSDLSSITWPVLPADNCVLIFDRPLVLKYLTESALLSIVNSAAAYYNAKKVVVRIDPNLLDDSRLKDRFDNVCQLKLPQYVVHQFNYSPSELFVIYKRKVPNAFGI